MARSGSNASGLPAASRRLISTASWMTASASSRRPRDDRRAQKSVQRLGQIRFGRRWVDRGEPPVEFHGFASDRQCLFKLPGFRQITAEVIQQGGQLGLEPVRVGRRQPPEDSYSFPGCSQCLFPPPQVRQVAAEVTQ